jgi:predicted dehydrogenase
MSAPLRAATRRSPRLGFLGVGRIGCRRLEALARTGAATPVVLCDFSVDALSQGIKVAPDAYAVCRPAELLNADIDGVVIATPSALHAEQAIAAFERGLAVFCQKPLARSAIETRQVIAAARAANRLLGVDLSYRFTKAMGAVRGVVRDGLIGEVFAAELTFHNAYGPDKPWFFDRALSGGGCVIDLGTHLVDLALWTLEFPKVRQVSSRLYAGGRHLDQPALASTVEDYAEAQLLLSSGAVVRIACSWKISMGRDAVISAVFHGTKGSAAFHNLNGSFFDFVAERYQGTQREILVGPPDDWGGAALVSWAERLALGDRFDPAIERMVDVAETLDAIAGIDANRNLRLRAL